MNAHLPLVGIANTHISVSLGHLPLDCSLPTQAACISSGFQGLDALITGGWQRGGVVELLSKSGGCGELRLLLPCIAALTQAAGYVTLVGAPQRIHAPAWAMCGVDVKRLQCANPQQARDILLAIDTALDKHHGGAVLAWIPHALPETVIRYLQRKAEASNNCVFFLRATQEVVESKSGSSLLRLFITPGQGGLWVSLPGSTHKRHERAFIAMAQRVLPPVVAGVIRHAPAAPQAAAMALAA